jgi:hypothetical protein
MTDSLKRRSSRAIAPLALVGLIAAACQGAAATPAPTATAEPSPAPASSAAAATVAMGGFHGVDGQASGSAALKHLPDGSFEVVFEDFSTAGTDHTSVILVSNADVAATTDVDRQAILDLGPLKAASGMQEYLIPAEMASNAMGYHTVVIWDTTMLHALAAAPLIEP